MCFRTLFKMAGRIPKGTFMNVTDGWNEYHSILLREGDSHVTIFFTPFGSFCYTTEPQGFVSSSDGYNCCFSAILYDFDRKKGV